MKVGEMALELRKKSLWLSSWRFEPPSCGQSLFDELDEMECHRHDLDLTQEGATLRCSEISRDQQTH